MVIEITDQNFDQEVLKSDKAILVDFWAPWCGPCRTMGPIVEELSQKIGSAAKVGKMNVDENPNKASEYGIMSIPSLKIFKDGKIVKEFVGVQNLEILKSELEKA